eukprot:Phypoly_transcript_06025.p1 GENE.Phypoly_transcript_06025~~Phypoly_transcript_06025.p1  ORF type:complete len:282 (+),score=34.46 Phypoly_transcript_06025:853-1698(+)
MVQSCENQRQRRVDKPIPSFLVCFLLRFFASFAGQQQIILYQIKYFVPLKSCVEWCMKIPVYLNVYDLHHANTYGYHVGLGAFHTGIEIGDKEFAYGGHEYNFTGVYESTPRAALGAIFRESVLLGETSLTRQEVQNVVTQLAQEYTGNGYHPFTRNCNSFSNDLSLRLLNRPIPSYINRLPYLGSFMSCIPMNTLLSFVGFTPPTGQPIEATPTNDTSPFYGTGYSLGTDSASPAGTGVNGGTAAAGTGTVTHGILEESDEARRERVATAAYKRLSKPMT